MPTDSSKKNETLEGCDRFKEAEFKEADPCMRRVVVIMLMTIAIILTVIGDAVSEKPKLNGLMLTIAGGLMVFAIITWQDMQGKIESFTVCSCSVCFMRTWVFITSFVCACACACARARVCVCVCVCVCACARARVCVRGKGWGRRWEVHSDITHNFGVYASASYPIPSASTLEL